MKSSERRNTELVVETLILTAMYQASLSPPGGLWQALRTVTNLLQDCSGFSLITPCSVSWLIVSYLLSMSVIIPDKKAEVYSLSMSSFMALLHMRLYRS
ncbi:hypothetical protein GH714_038551 [Hevea brasiliensis]|uniref:PGG domain-containing protein n=1 Tax=Hevea brasiliensis TaxID=3981 RepID=A0A6A6N533_HEVBR|nr:hypothetical protein GH714_038551 [Hevea brasiliensis]